MLRGEEERLPWDVCLKQVISELPVNSLLAGFNIIELHQLRSHLKGSSSVKRKKRKVNIADYITSIHSTKLAVQYSHKIINLLTF